MVLAHLHHVGRAGTDGVLGWLVVVVATTIASGGQLRAVRRRRERTGRPWNRWRTASWSLGVLLVAGALSPPLAALAQTDPRGHMAQHLLLGMFAPLALVLAAPVTLLLGASSGAVRRRTGAALGSRAVHVLSHPVAAGLLSTGGLYVLYLTPLHGAAQRSALLHTAVSTHLLVAGVVFAWAIAGPDPARRRPGTGVRVAALVLSAAAHGVLAKLLFAGAGGPALQAGDPAPHAGDGASRVEQAAQLMFYGGDVAELLLASALFAARYRRRPRGTAERTLPSRGPAARALPSPTGPPRAAPARSALPRVGLSGPVADAGGATGPAG